MILTFSLPFGMQKVILFASTQTAVCDVFTQVGIPITLYSFPIFILFTDSSKIIKDKRKMCLLNETFTDDMVQRSKTSNNLIVQLAVKYLLLFSITCILSDMNNIN